MPMKRELYSPDWPNISRRIREGRAGNKCEVCGVANGAVILRSTIDAERYLILNLDDGIHYFPDGERVRVRFSEIPEEYDTNTKYTKVVLTVAHLNHDPSDNSDENLKCLCQLHHLRHDAKHHAETRKANARKRGGQLELPL